MVTGYLLVKFLKLLGEGDTRVLKENCWAPIAAKESSQEMRRLYKTVLGPQTTMSWIPPKRMFQTVLISLQVNTQWFLAFHDFG